MLLPLVFAVAGALAVSGSAVQSSPEATSLLGKPLISPPASDTVRARLEADLTAARAAVDRAPDDPDARIWVGRRLAYLGRYRDAIAVFTEGVARFPKDARFLRHRGHRYITVREFDKAIADLERADALVAGAQDQIEPDGQPNARNIPLTTLHSNIRYHLALAYYLTGDFAKAAPEWQRARDAVRNPDNLVSATHWLYLTLRRQGRADEAGRALDGIVPGLDVVENSSYYSLCQLYKGMRTEDDVLKAAGTGSAGAAVVYGVAVWHDVNGRAVEADALRRQLVDGQDWAPFGVIAAEADLARAKKAPSVRRQLAPGIPDAQTSFSELWPDVFVDLAYPPAALAARVDGAVVVRVTTDESGRVIGAEALSGPAGLVSTVLDSVKQWTVSRGARTGVIVYRFEIDHARCNDDRRSLFRLKRPNLAVVTACTEGGSRGIVSPIDQLPFTSTGGPGVYPSIAFNARITGVVVLELTLDAKGMVVDSRPLTELPLLTEAAVAHSKTWRFEPTERRRGIFVYEFAQDLRTCDDGPTDFWRVTADFWRLSTCSPVIGGGRARRHASRPAA